MALEMSFGDFDLQKVETWPWPVKALACLIVFVLVIAGGWYFAHNDQMATISDSEKKQRTAVRKPKSRKQPASRRKKKPQLQPIKRNASSH